jgi:quercetin dioxygenase-like cupin family protein
LFQAHSENKREKTTMHRALLAVVLVFLTGAVAMAQDPTKAAAKQYKTEVDNAQVRVLKIHYGPHEKSAMHSHPNSVVILFTEGHVKFTGADGKSQEETFKAGEARWTPAVTHSVENLSDKDMEGILVELKGKAPAKPAAKAAK